MPKPTQDYYKVLGVPRDASREVIRQAYRRLARKRRPDTDGGSSEQFQILRDAYKTLVNTETRARYDRALLRDQEAPASRSASGEIFLLPKEAARGGTLPVDVPVRSVCRACRGGALSWGCPYCMGEGQTVSRMPIAVHIPSGVKDGTVIQIRLHTATPSWALLTVHVGQYK